MLRSTLAYRVADAGRMLIASPRLRRILRTLGDAAFRREQKVARQRFDTFAVEYRHLLPPAPMPRANRSATALVVSGGVIESLPVQFMLTHALQVAGYATVAAIHYDPLLAKYLALGGIDEIHYWHPGQRRGALARARTLIDGCDSIEGLLKIEYDGARVGRYSASTSLRRLRVGELDFRSASTKQRIASALAHALTSAEEAQRLLDRVRPDLALFLDRGYSPFGELFDACLRRGVDTLTWNGAHKSNHLMLKRYSMANRDRHPSSLSAESWDLLKQMAWSERLGHDIRSEIFKSYETGDWYGEAGTQFNKRVLARDELRRRLGLRDGRKCAMVLPHILWDGTFFWGHDLFRSYEEWLLATVRAACANTELDWIVKVHPANLVKNVREGVSGEPADVVSIRKHLSALPPHVTIIPAESDISTFSLFSVADYCLTVRGTVGIEAALFGIPVLTAGTGRYDSKGFTIDSGSRDEYLDRLAHLQEIPPLSVEQRQLAEKFAYGVFGLRPAPLTSVTLEYARDARATIRSRILVSSMEEWSAASDVNSIAQWMSGRQEDYLAPGSIPAAADGGRQAVETLSVP